MAEAEDETAATTPGRLVASATMVRPEARRTAPPATTSRRSTFSMRASPPKRTAKIDTVKAVKKAPTTMPRSTRKGAA